MASEKQINQAVSKLVKAYALFKPDPDAFKAFMEIVIDKMKPFPSIVIEKAINNIIETSKFFPQISEMMSHCWKVRDEEMSKLGSRLQSYKDDWMFDKIHSQEEWNSLIDEFTALDSHNNADYVRQCYEKYGEKGERIAPEKIKELAENKIRNLAKSKEA
jgi:hypothetical protein